MTDDISVRRFDLSTDRVVNATINGLLQKRYLITEDSAITATKHITLRCGHATCPVSWSAKVNSSTAYAHPLAHMFRHHWDGPTLGQQAAYAVLERIASAGQSGVVDYVSPPPKQLKKSKAREVVAESSTSPMRAASGNWVEMKSECLKDTAYMVASTYLPFNWFTTEAVKRWFTSLGSCFAPNVGEVTLAVQVHGQEVLADTLRTLSSSPFGTTLAVDSVTNVNHHKIYSIVMLHQGEAWFYCSWNLKSTEDTAVSAHAALSNCVTTLQQHHVKVSAITTDNANGMIAARRLVAKEFGMLSIGCAAHMVHNSATYLIEQLEPILKPFDVFLKQYKEDKKLRCMMDDEDAARVYRPNETRWSSYLYALVSIQRNRPQLDRLTGRPTTKRKKVPALDWLILDDVVAILQNWEKHNKVVQADSASLVDYFNAIVGLSAYLQQLIDGTAAGITSTTVLGCGKAFLSTKQYILKRWNKLECRDAISAAAYLARARSTEFNCDVNTTHKFIRDSAVKLMQACHIPLPAGDVAGLLIKQLAEAEAPTAPWRYVELESTENKSKAELVNAVSYYKRRLRYDEACLLASLAVILLTITPSEASVERLFSRLKLLWTAKRNSLHVSTVDNLLHLAMNGKRLRQMSELATHQQASSKWWLVAPAAAADEQDEIEAAEDVEDDS